MCPLVTLRGREERYRSSNQRAHRPHWRHRQVWLEPRVSGRVDRQDKPPDPACPGSGPHGVRPERGSSRPAETSSRRRTDATRSRWCRCCSRRLVLVTATSASTGAIRSAAAASARCSTEGGRSGAGVGDQVTVTDSHHPALRMAPAASSRCQCPRDSCTCCCPSAWLSPGRECPEASRIGTLCAGLLSFVTGEAWSFEDVRGVRLAARRRPAGPSVPLDRGR